MANKSWKVPSHILSQSRRPSSQRGAEAYVRGGIAQFCQRQTGAMHARFAVCIVAAPAWPSFRYESTRELYARPP